MRASASPPTVHLKAKRRARRGNGWPPRADGPIRATVDLTVEPVAETRSTLTIAVDFTGHGVGKLLVPLVVRGQARKEMPANLARLKARLEAGAAAEAS